MVPRPESPGWRENGEHGDGFSVGGRDGLLDEAPWSEYLNYAPTGPAFHIIVRYQTDHGPGGTTLRSFYELRRGTQARWWPGTEPGGGPIFNPISDQSDATGHPVCRLKIAIECACPLGVRNGASFRSVC